MYFQDGLWGVIVDDVLALEGVSNEDEDGRIFCSLCFCCWVWVFAEFFVHQGCLTHQLINGGLNLDVTSGTLVMYSGIIV